MILSVRDICKSFGAKRVLDSVSFEALAGKPLGLLGRNGAGKTTAMRIIMGMLSADSGEVLFDGRSTPCDIPLGYLPEERGLYRKSKIGEQLVYFARLRGMDFAAAKLAVRRKLESFDVLQYIDSTPETLSKGTQQRIQLALAMINDPEILILDEPFSGLDPVNSMQLKSIIRDYAASGKTVIFSSHQMSSVEDFCTDIVIINNGSVALSGELSEIRSGMQTDRIFIETEGDFSGIIGKYGSAAASGRGYTVELADKNLSGAMLSELISLGAVITKFETVKPTLEEIFISCVGEEAVSV